MKTSSLKLRTKGLLVVLALLALEVLFVGLYALLLAKAEEETAKEQRTKEIIARASDLVQALYTAGDNVAKYSFSRDLSCLSKYEKANADIPTQIAWIRKQLKSDQAQLSLLDKIEANVTSGLAMLAEMKKVSDTEAQIVAMQYGIKLRGKMQHHMEGLVKDLSEFLKTEKQIEKASPAAQRLQMERIKWLLLIGVALNIGAAVLSILFFVRSITSRLTVVADNSERLLERKTLRAPLIGEDEIARLDRAFHEMSHSLRGEEELVIASQEQLKAIIDQMPIGLMILTDDQKIEYANPTLEKLLDYKHGALVGTRLSNHFGAAAGSAGAAVLTDATPVEGVVELVARKQDQSELPVEFSVTDVSLGNMLRRLAIIIDVSAKHEVEKMRQAFVAMVSHELRTPLTSVAGFLQLLPMGVYGQIAGPAVDDAKVAEEHVEQLIMLINDLLDLEKLEAGKLEMTRTQISLEDAIDSALDSVYSLAETLHVPVLFEGCQVSLRADGDRLQQAISKMLNCLLRVSPAGDTINIVVEEAGDKTVAIMIRSAKLDLSHEKMQSMFEPFQQLDLPEAGGSLGLGLPLARAIVAQHGGACGATKGAAGGTTLWMQFPR